MESRGWEFYGWPPLRQFTLTVHLTCSLSLKYFSFNKIWYTHTKEHLVAFSLQSFSIFYNELLYIIHWMVSPSRWTWVWASSRSWWWTEKPGTLQSMGSQRVGPDWATEMNWTELKCYIEWDLLLRLSTTDNPGPVSFYLQFCLQVMLIHVFGFFSWSHFCQNFFFPPLGW